MADELPRRYFKNMEDRAERDDEITMIRDYFDEQTRWVREGRNGIRLYKGKRFIHRTFYFLYRNRENDAYGMVNFRIEGPNDRVDRFGYIINRGGERTDDLWVQNGILRSERKGRIDSSSAELTAASSADDPSECLIGNVVGSVDGRGAICGVVSVGAGALCGRRGGPLAAGACGGSAALRCDEVLQPSNLCSGGAACPGLVPVYCDIFPTAAECTYGAPEYVEECPA